jgi:CMP-N-acetylneuraminic acid synthetase
MRSTLNIIAIIPAKATSKRVPGKNLKLLAGKPLLAHIIETSKRVKAIDRVIVSTESDEIGNVARAYGADVIERPLALTKDDTTTHEVLVHAIQELERQGEKPDYILLLYPTSPLLQKERIEEAIAIARDHASASVVSGYLDRGHYWIEKNGKWSRLYPEHPLNTQFQTPLFVENGALYLTRTDVAKRAITADVVDVLVMDRNESIDIDEPEDFERVRGRLEA